MGASAERNERELSIQGSAAGRESWLQSRPPLGPAASLAAGPDPRMRR